MLKITKLLFVLLGLISVALGTLGAILPVLPTTPFLLLAFYFFTRGSQRWNNWFIGTALYKKHLESYLERGGMTVKQKVSILLLADIMIAFPFIMAENIMIRLMLGLLVLVKYAYFIFGIKTI